MMTNEEKKEGRKYWLEMIGNGISFARGDSQVEEVGDDYVKLKVPDFDGIAMHEAYMSLYDYGRSGTIIPVSGEFFVRQGFGYPLLAFNKEERKGGYKNSATYVHTYVTDKLGFRHFRNGNTLDCRRQNLVTDDVLETAPPDELSFAEEGEVQRDIRVRQKEKYKRVKERADQLASEQYEILNSPAVPLSAAEARDIEIGKKQLRDTAKRHVAEIEHGSKKNDGSYVHPTEEEHAKS